MQEPVAQVIEAELAVIDIAADPPIYHQIKSAHARLTVESSSRQQLEHSKPRMGAHLMCCEHSGVPDSDAHIACSSAFTSPLTARSDSSEAPRSPRPCRSPSCGQDREGTIQHHHGQLHVDARAVLLWSWKRVLVVRCNCFRLQGAVRPKHRPEPGALAAKYVPG